MGSRSVQVLLAVCAVGVMVFFYSYFSQHQEASVNDVSANSLPAKNESISVDDTSESVKESEIQNTRSAATTSPTVLHSSEGSVLKTRKLPDQYNVRQKSQGVSVHQAQLRSHPWLADIGWKIWSGKRAVLGRVSEDRVAGYAVEDGVASTIDQFRSDKPILVYEEASGTVGVLTGQFEVIYNAPIAQDRVSYEGVKVISGVPDLGVYYMTANTEPFDLRQFKSFLEAQDNVKTVRVMIKSRSREKF